MVIWSVGTFGVEVGGISSGSEFLVVTVGGLREFCSLSWMGFLVLFASSSTTVVLVDILEV